MGYIGSMICSDCRKLEGPTQQTINYRSSPLTKGLLLMQTFSGVEKNKNQAKGHKTSCPLLAYGEKSSMAYARPHAQGCDACTCALGIIVLA